MSSIKNLISKQYDTHISIDKLKNVIYKKKHSRPSSSVRSQNTEILLKP
jgi:hypothetical protein